ncbi:MAG: Uncharacterized protein K0R12_1126 [Gammaproteobacteria bacterium]|jgi:hypothetical protein|nr:Uncharacterized protein [Gammaproteobacteria bacterium]
MHQTLSLFWRTPSFINKLKPMVLGDNLKRVKASFNQCAPEAKTLFLKSSAQVTISVDQPIHYGAKFHATMNLIQKHFTSCKIMVDDTVQRHTYAILHPEKSDDELYHLSYAKGNTWIAESINTLSNLKIPCQVIRWNRWLTHPEFPRMLKIIEDLYQNDKSYRESVESSIIAYLDRFLKRHPDVDPEHAYKCCVTYLQEECAGMTLWPELGCQFEIYPSGRNGAMEATYDRFIKPNHPELLKIVALRFSKKAVTHETDIDLNEIVDDSYTEETNTEENNAFTI